MTIEELQKYFKGGAYEFERITKLNHTNWYNWVNKGYIPIMSQIKLERIMSQLKLEKITDGGLKADWELFDKQGVIKSEDVKRVKRSKTNKE